MVSIQSFLITPEFYLDQIDLAIVQYNREMIS